MEIRAQVIAKIENVKGEYFSVRITWDGKQLQFQGQDFVPTIEVNEKLFNAVEVTDELVFIHNDTVHGVTVE